MDGKPTLMGLSGKIEELLERTDYLSRTLHQLTERLELAEKQLGEPVPELSLREAVLALVAGGKSLRDELAAEELMRRAKLLVQTVWAESHVIPAAKRAFVQQVFEEQGKIPAIKEVRMLMNIGLREAKEVVERHARDENWKPPVYKV